MPVEQIGEAMTGTADGVNRVFALSHVPNLNTLQVFVNMVAVAIESIDGTGLNVTLSGAPPNDAQVFASYLYSAPDDKDLTTLANVKGRAEVKSNTEDSEIQRLITAFSQHVYVRTGRRALNQVTDFLEAYDGNGARELRLLDSPITALRSVKINNVSQTISTSYGIPGLAITGNGKYIGFVHGAFGRFVKGIQTIQVDYSAGYDGVPADLEDACCEAVAIAVKRKAWLDLKSKSISVQGGAGTTSYRDWELPPHVERVLDSYTRKVVLA